MHPVDFTTSLSEAFAAFPDLPDSGRCNLSFFVKTSLATATAFRAAIARLGGRAVGDQTISRCYVKLSVVAEIGAVNRALQQISSACFEAGVVIEAIDLDASDAEHPAWFVNLACA